jgi:hypothetical protein
VRESERKREKARESERKREKARESERKREKARESERKREKARERERKRERREERKREKRERKRVASKRGRIQVNENALYFNFNFIKLKGRTRKNEGVESSHIGSE